MTDSLYVMQSSLGHIKIGRSRDPEKRRRGLEHQCGLPVTLLLTLEGEGDREGEFFYELYKFRLKGEWFVNCPASRTIIMALAARDDIAFATKPVPRPAKRAKTSRKVRHILADGTLKVYSYPPYERRFGQIWTNGQTDEIVE